MSPIRRYPISSFCAVLPIEMAMSAARVGRKTMIPSITSPSPNIENMLSSSPYIFMTVRR